MSINVDNEPGDLSEDIFSLRQKVGELAAERRKRKEYTSRLQNKLHVLNEELVFRKEQIPLLKEKLEQERKKKANVETEQLSQQQIEAYKVKGHLEEILNKRLPKQATSLNAHSNLIVCKPADVASENALNVDTVLVTFVPEGQSNQYQLTIRVDKHCKIHQLLSDSCRYWGVSEAEFVLVTLAGSKVADCSLVQDCFLHGEVSHLFLKLKDVRNTSITEAERREIFPKSTAAEKQFGVKSTVADYRKLGEEFPGLFHILKQQERAPVAHVSHIKLRDILLYILFLVLTCVLFVRNLPPGDGYWLVFGIRRNTVGSSAIDEISDFQRANATEMTFNDINSVADVWDWHRDYLQNLFENTSPLRSSNIPIGFMRIRQQKVKEEKCNYDRLAQFTECYPTFVTSSTEQTDFLAGINVLPQGCDDRCENPNEWRSHSYNQQKHKIGQFYGRLQSFGASGYSLDIPIVATNFDKVTWQTYINMVEQSGWVSKDTRLISVEFALYNPANDRWLSCLYTFEVSSAGVVVGRWYIRPFTVNIMETAGEIVNMILEALRFLCIIYISVVITRTSMIKYREDGRAGWYHFISMEGICDILLTTVYLTNFIIRMAFFVTKSSTTAAEESIKQFISWNLTSFLYELIQVFETLLLLLITIRIWTFFRINRRIYVLWRAIGAAVIKFCLYMVIFLPVFFGFAVMAHVIWGPYLETFETLGLAILSLIMFLYGFEFV
eukprot:GHVL01018745.1.p1 GENE.GHVL01018745.1~~GHVL01018745.1.p1  ORF type:complete len:724 (+),score=62.41 GHVL01018745.1:41-2212(+)